MRVRNKLQRLSMREISYQFASRLERALVSRVHEAHMSGF
jgi:hypothetical protein